MANLPESATWETGIYQLEKSDRVQGGASGVSNNQAKQLANRTSYLYANKANVGSPTFTGVPSAPTASADTSTTQIATTAFVRSGVNDASNAATGSVGEYQSNTGTSISLTTNVNVNLAQLSLTAGDWDVTGVGQFVGGNATLIKLGIHTTSAAFGAFNTFIQVSANFPASSTSNINGPASYRLSVNTTTTVYLVAMSTFSSTQTAQGFIAARRVR